MTILGIETSCDETAAAVLTQENKKISVLSQTIASSLDLHAKTGGIIPEVAAREQLRYIISVIEKTLADAKKTLSTIDAIAVTYGPGLIGSLLVGVETAKTLSFVHQIPLIPINHLYGHIFANWIDRDNDTCTFPALALIVSGGHTDIVVMRSKDQLQWIGGTRDDAAGECFDKCARLLGFPYPGGPKISELAKHGDPNFYQLPQPMPGANNFDFSFSGLKTAFMNLVKKEFQLSDVALHNNKFNWAHIEEKGTTKEKQNIYDMCASLEKTIVENIVKKTILAAKKYDVKTILVGGGVSANKLLRKTLETKCQENDFVLHIPQPIYCTDNAAMIAAAALINPKAMPLADINATPDLYFA